VPYIWELITMLVFPDMNAEFLLKTPSGENIRARDETWWVLSFQRIA
jgi:hypothetical protein